MNYGLYLSASGVMANSYRQDVIANNLANSETVGFRRDLALFQERRTAFQERGGAGFSDPMLEKIGGGILAVPTRVDVQQGDLEPTNNPLDVAIKGSGYFAVTDGHTKHLTRDGRFMLDHNGDLVLSSEQGNRILDDKGRPIKLESSGKIAITDTGVITQNEQPVARIGLYDVPDPSRFTKLGANLLSYPDPSQLRPATGMLRSGFQEQSNVDPSTELSQLMDTQRQLEANANMIKYQDSMMQALVNTVGKIT